MQNENEKPKTGPDPERLKIDGDWTDVVKKAIAKPRPEGGWPPPRKAAGSLWAIYLGIHPKTGSPIFLSSEDGEPLVFDTEESAIAHISGNATSKNAVVKEVSRSLQGDLELRTD